MWMTALIEASFYRQNRKQGENNPQQLRQLTAETVLSSLKILFLRKIKATNDMPGTFVLAKLAKNLADISFKD